MKQKGLILGISLVLLLAMTTADAQAQCCYFNPFLLPFAVAGAVVGTAAAITTAVAPLPVYPIYPGPYYGPRRAYYAPGPYYGARPYYGPWPYYSRPIWIRPHYNRYGAWIPGHWR